MINTSNYNLLLAEGTDLVNYLTQTNPNFSNLDSIIKAVSDATVTQATEVTTGTAHAISRTLPDANVIRFTATSNWVTGDTMTVDGVSVTPLKTDGTTLKSGDYLIGAAVLMILDGTRCTVFVSSSPDAAEIRYDNTGSGLTSTDVQDAIDEVNNTLSTNLTDLRKNNLGTRIALSLNDVYAFPSDGYLHMATDTAVNSRVVVVIYGRNGSGYFISDIQTDTLNYPKTLQIYVRNGMYVVVSTLSVGASCAFIPFA